MIDVLWVLFVALGILSAVANALSLAQGARFLGHVRRGLRMAFGAYLPRVVILLPVRGLDGGFDENVRAILSQAYPTYRVVAVADDPGDPALIRVTVLAREVPRVALDRVVSDSTELGGKVNALRSALRLVRPGDEVVVFADADIRPAQDWLRQLVQPLADATVGAATGFRWYVPPRPTFWSLVRAEWNAVSANVLFDPGRNYVWGGSCAVRSADLQSLRLAERWRDVLSDDLVLTRVLREAGRSIAYAPPALVATHEGADRAVCTEWCLRQMTMAVLYHPGLRRYAAGAFAVFNGAVVLGGVSLVLAALASWTFLVPAALFLVTLPATVAKASLRRRAFFAASPAVARAWKVPRWRATLAALAVPWLMLAGLIRTRRPEVVRWRGRVYDVRDPAHVRLLEGRPTETDAS